MRIGIFGGSFDPVHDGHLLAAECAREQARLERVIFVPAAESPHKVGVRLADASHRLAMLSLAIGGNDSFSVSSIELDRGGTSFTVDTLAELAEKHPGDTLVLLLGPDSLAGLGTWREPERIATLAEIVPIEREQLDDVRASTSASGLADILGEEAVSAMLARRVRMPAIGIRATPLREAVARGKSIRYRTPRAVERYIATHGLYRAG
jgi:nicotinate-nucleotide adenylyltransferase